MPHKRAKASIRRAKKGEVDLPVTASDSQNDGSKAFSKILRFAEKVKQQRLEKKDAAKKEKENIAKMAILPGESARDFAKRVNSEFQKDINKAVKASKPVTARKKRNRETRKQKKQEKKQRIVDQYGGRDFDDLKDQVKFGEVANAPPTLNKIPKARGRAKEALEKKTQQAVQKSSDGNISEEDDNMKQFKASHKRKLANMSASARKALEDERERTIEMYRAKKAKKMTESGMTPFS